MSFNIPVLQKNRFINCAHLRVTIVCKGTTTTNYGHGEQLLFMKRLAAVTWV